MLHRIVKLTFTPAGLEALEQVLAKAAARVRTREGCLHMHMMRSDEEPGLIFTYSLWRDAGALDAYRHSEAFQTMWGTIKPHFAARPEAHSLRLANGSLPVDISQTT